MKTLEPVLREEEHDILFGVINRFIGYFTRQAVPRTSNDTSLEYPFVAMDTRQAYEQLRVARSYLQRNSEPSGRFSFIDIGCGIGNILLLAEMMDFSVFGIEKDEGSVGIARQLLGEELVSQTDLWHFARLPQFDVVYYFRPFGEKHLQCAFEHFVEKQIKPGAVLIANRKMDNGIEKNPHFLKIDPDLPIWQKIDG